MTNIEGKKRNNKEKRSFIITKVHKYSFKMYSNSCYSLLICWTAYIVTYNRETKSRSRIKMSITGLPKIAHVLPLFKKVDPPTVIVIADQFLFWVVIVKL